MPKYIEMSVVVPVFDDDQKNMTGWGVIEAVILDSEANGLVTVANVKFVAEFDEFDDAEIEARRWQQNCGSVYVIKDEDDE